MQFDPSHNSDIINYYYTNYSTCPKDTNYFATWRFLTTFTHLLLVLEVPLMILTAYCILKKTPKAMGNLKWAMLNVHFWSTYVDLLFCSLATPYIYFPTFCGFSVGVLQALGVPTSIQTYLGVSSVGFMFNANCALFENRSSSFQMNRFRFERTASRFTFFILNGVVMAVILLPVFLMIPDQNDAKFRCLVKLKCPTEEFFTSPVFVLLMDASKGYYITVLLSLQFTFTSLASIFFICCTVYHLFYSKQGSYSEKTKKLQMMFFIGNLVQVAIPFVFWVGPSAILLPSYFMNYHNQAINNLCIAFLSLHGLVAMIAVLVIHHPYRTFMKSMLGVEGIEVVSVPTSNVIT